MSLKWHKDCGGIVRYKEGKKGCGFEKAGECQKCGCFPLNEENIIFEIDKEKVERFYEPCESCGRGSSKWLIVSKKSIKEILEEDKDP